MPSEYPRTIVITPYLPLRTFRECADSLALKYEEKKGVLYFQRFAMYVTSIGKESIEAFLQKMKATGVENIIFVGSAGAITGLEIGQIFLVDVALNLLGSKLLGGAMADQDLMNAFQAFKSIPQKKAVTVEEPMAEDNDIMAILRQNGINAVEMEIFYLYKWAKECQRKAVALCYVTDIPGQKPYNIEHAADDKKKLIAAREDAIKTALTFASKV